MLHAPPYAVYNNNDVLTVANRSLSDAGDGSQSLVLSGFTGHGFREKGGSVTFFLSPESDPRILDFHVGVSRGVFHDLPCFSPF